MGGDINVQSYVGLGSTFTLRVNAEVFYNSSKDVELNKKEIVRKKFFKALVAIKGPQVYEQINEVLNSINIKVQRVENLNDIPMIISNKQFEFILFDYETILLLITYDVHLLQQIVQSKSSQISVLIQSKQEKDILLSQGYCNLEFIEKVIFQQKFQQMVDKLKENMKIVIIDDDKFQSNIVANQISQLDFEFQAFNDIDKALQYIKQFYKQIFLIITDYEIGDRNGRELLDEVRNYELLTGLEVAKPIILLSGHKSKNLEEGFSEVLVKPIMFQNLQNTIHRFMQ